MLNKNKYTSLSYVSKANNIMNACKNILLSITKKETGKENRLYIH